MMYPRIFRNIQGSQTSVQIPRKMKYFTPLQTYKVLKQSHNTTIVYYGFTPLQTYKVLKRPYWTRNAS